MVRRRLAKADVGPEPAMASTGARPAAVLIPLFEESGLARVILTRRAAGLASHRGEVAFPGGVLAPGESELDAALREAEEEVGLDPGGVSVVGRLPRVVTPTTGFVLTPFVGVLPGRPLLEAGPDEVEEVFDVSLARLLDPAIYREERWDRPVADRPVYFFELGHDTVWGVTARILHRLLCLVTGTSP
ncbi:MAG TPA: CoA pyrophosphatase [Acidimicrobiales bacterium]|nr:CoA pyrophosphatase [Acidimicrobiales bacterium]